MKVARFAPGPDNRANTVPTVRFSSGIAEAASPRAKTSKNIFLKKKRSTENSWRKDGGQGIVRRSKYLNTLK